MMIAVGHLTVIFDGVAEGGEWRGKWTIHRPEGGAAAKDGRLLLVDDGETPELHPNREAATEAARKRSVARAHELHNER